MARLNIGNPHGIAPLTAGGTLAGDGLPKPVDLGTFRFAGSGFADSGAAGVGPGAGGTALGLAMDGATPSWAAGLQPPAVTGNYLVPAGVP